MKWRILFGLSNILQKAPVQQPITKPEQSYSDTFLTRNEIKKRQCVYISYDVHCIISRLVRRLTDQGQDISIGGYIDVVLNEHLQLHKEEINEIYRQRPEDLL